MPDEILAVKTTFEGFIKDKDVISHTRIGSFREKQDGNISDEDKIFEIPAIQGATITTFLTFWGKIESHEKAEEEIGILLNPVPDNDFDVKIWKLKAKAVNRIYRGTIFHAGSNDLHVEFEMACYMMPKIMQA